MSRQDGDWYTPIIGAKIEKNRSVQKIDRGKQGSGGGGGLLLLWWGYDVCLFVYSIDERTEDLPSMQEPGT